MHISIGEYNGNKMLVIKKDENQEFAAFQGGMRKFLPILQALTENPDEVLTIVEMIGGDKGIADAKAFRTKYNVPSKIANSAPPAKKEKKAKAKA